MKIPRSEWDKPGDQPKLFPAGYYYVEITDAKEHDDGYLAVSYKVLACPDHAEMAGCRDEERFYGGNAIGKYSVLAKRLGLQDRSAPSDEAADVDHLSMIGARLIVEMEHRRRKSEKGTEYDAHQWKWGGCWPLDHKEAPAQVVQWLRQRAAPASERQPGDDY